MVGGVSPARDVVRRWSCPLLVAGVVTPHPPSAGARPPVRLAQRYLPMFVTAQRGRRGRPEPPTSTPCSARRSTILRAFRRRRPRAVARRAGPTHRPAQGDRAPPGQRPGREPAARPRRPAATGSAAASSSSACAPRSSAACWRWRCRSCRTSTSAPTRPCTSASATATRSSTSRRSAGTARRTRPSRTGGRMPLHCTAIGKALLAHADPALRQRGARPARWSVVRRTRSWRPGCCAASSTRCWRSGSPSSARSRRPGWSASPRRCSVRGDRRRSPRSASPARPPASAPSSTSPPSAPPPTGLASTIARREALTPTP